MLRSVPGEHVLYCEELPEIEFRDDMAHVRFRAGGLAFRVVLRPCIFQGALAVAHERNAKWRVEQLDHEVIALPAGRGRRRH